MTLLKADGKEKRGGGREGYSNSGSVWHCGERGFFLNFKVSFLSKTHYFRFRLLQLFK
jgi:hypothetical protein